jgi:hypothetical protein
VKAYTLELNNITNKFVNMIQDSAKKYPTGKGENAIPTINSIKKE